MISFLETLRELIEIGFSPFMALVIGALIVLAGVIGGGFMFFWRELGKGQVRLDRERKERDHDREEWHASVERRLEQAEERAATCEADRDNLHRKQAQLEIRVARLTACPNRDCPVRSAV